MYPSAEHAYQCLQKTEGSRVDWQVGGRYSDWDFVYDTLNKERETDNKKPLSTASWQTKKRQIGILAVLVIRRPEFVGFDFGGYLWYGRSFKGALRCSIGIIRGAVVSYFRGKI